MDSQRNRFQSVVIAGLITISLGICINLIFFEPTSAALRSDWKSWEAENIRRAPQYALRKGDVLELKLRDGKLLSLRNIGPEYAGDEDLPRNKKEIISFHFVDYLRDVGYYVIWEAGYEWDRYKLISDTSRKV